MTTELLTLGPVHLEVTDLRRSSEFWQDVIGLQLRHDTADAVELGTGDHTLVVLHGGAMSPVLQGYSGLYHIAIHPATPAEFGRLLVRLIRRRQPMSPVDHLMSKAIYLNDPDGIQIEITLEPPSHMLDSVVEGRKLFAIGVDGSRHSASEPLDLDDILMAIPEGSEDALIADDTKVGHLHLHVGDLEAAHSFYKTLGFIPNKYRPTLGGADLGAGGAFAHRIAINTWQGANAPQAPAGSARMRHFTVLFQSPAQLEAAARAVAAERFEHGYAVKDPSGNRIVLANSI